MVLHNLINHLTPVVHHEIGKNTDHKSSTILQISEYKIAIGYFPGNVVLMGCIWAITYFIILRTFWVFTVNVPFMEKPCS